MPINAWDPCKWRYLRNLEKKKNRAILSFLLCKNSSKCKKVLNKREYSATIILFMKENLQISIKILENFRHIWILDSKMWHFQVNFCSFFYLKNIISTHTKGILMVLIFQILKTFFILKSPNFYNRFQQVGKILNYS